MNSQQTEYTQTLGLFIQYLADIIFHTLPTYHVFPTAAHNVTEIKLLEQLCVYSEERNVWICDWIWLIHASKPNNLLLLVRIHCLIHVFHPSVSAVFMVNLLSVAKHLHMYRF